MFSMKTDYDAGRIGARFGTAFNEAQFWLDNAVLKDSTPYVPRDEGFLETSGISGSVIGSGELVYNTPYAKAQYYGLPNKSKDVHPQATCQWTEKAKAAMLKAWRDGVGKLIGRW